MIRSVVLLALWGCLWSQSLRAVPFSDCINQLKQQAREQQLADWVVQELNQVEHSERVIELDRRQPEFSETFFNYLNKRVTPTRIETGRVMLKRHQGLLNRLTTKYGVPPQYIVAFWGLETNFGSYLGKMNVLDSLATLACDERRSTFFTRELMAALHIIGSKSVTRANMLGSWAGAMGNMQFMPSTYRQYGMDGDGDGKIDLWGSIEDALTSAAYYLQQLGWERNLRWGREVLLPDDFNYGMGGLDEAKPLRYWAGLGLRNVRNQRLPGLDIPASLVIPAGHQGPSFIVYENFRVIMQWNRSQYYAIAVGHLADRIKGGGELSVTPPDVERLSVETVQQLQIKLNALGFDAGEADGVMGSNTKRAIRDFQLANQMIADGFASPSVVVRILAAMP